MGIFKNKNFGHLGYLLWSHQVLKAFIQVPPIKHVFNVWSQGLWASMTPLTSSFSGHYRNCTACWRIWKSAVTEC